MTGILAFYGCNKNNSSVSSTASDTSSNSVAKVSYPLRNKGDESQKYGVYYEIFVRSFADSNGDGIGDLNGVTSKLDYLKSLGIQGIWLMPINPSPSYHGYDVMDYNSINSDYGTIKDFQNLVAKAHSDGIKVIMDFVVNHTSDKDPWFIASKDPKSKYRNYYHWVSQNDSSVDFDSETPWNSKEWHSNGDGYDYFAMFSDSMPDLNYDNPDVRTEIINSATKWLNMGVDGFRLDAAMHIYGANEPSTGSMSRTDKNLKWWNEFAIACEKVNPKVYLCGEAWQSQQVLPEYAQPFDTKFDFSFQSNLMSAVPNNIAMLADQSLADAFADSLKQNTDIDKKFIDGVFGANHDINRIMSQVNENVSEAKMVANIYMTLPGNPFIYYGEELGMQGQGKDENKREPLLWSNSKNSMTATWESDSDNSGIEPADKQMTDKDSLFNYYKSLIALRKAHPVFFSGTFTSINANTNVMGYLRQDSNEGIYVFNNLLNEAVTFSAKDAKFGNILFKTNDKCKINGTTITLDADASIIIQQAK
ncbi:MAG: alpha-amylase family glycosyl hydrolase [Bacillota bacterium]|nr:alpha-amylase family glycosyl hydrolase [Bacillota bacterium]